MEHCRCALVLERPGLPDEMVRIHGDSVDGDPPRDEQDEIVSLVDAAEDSIEAVQNEIDALDRLKRSLLQNLLTGRVRVRSEL